MEKSLLCVICNESKPKPFWELRATSWEHINSPVMFCLYGTIPNIKIDQMTSLKKNSRNSDLHLWGTDWSQHLPRDPDDPLEHLELNYSNKNPSDNNPWHLTANPQKLTVDLVQKFKLAPIIATPAGISLIGQQSLSVFVSTEGKWIPSDSISRLGSTQSRPNGAELRSPDGSFGSWLTTAICTRTAFSLIFDWKQKLYKQQPVLNLYGQVSLEPRGHWRDVCLEELNILKVADGRKTPK